MREILFRAKSASRDNPEWVEGYYAFDGTHWIDRMSEEYPGHTESIPINPETLGQFTGLTDKNGVKIFDGDIITQHKDDWGQPPFIRIVFWSDETYSFRISSPLLDNGNNIDKNDVIEVIGNIYDNPELLGGE